MAIPFQYTPPTGNATPQGSGNLAPATGGAIPFKYTPGLTVPAPKTPAVPVASTLPVNKAVGINKITGMNIDTRVNPFSFGNPIQDIKDAGNALYSAVATPNLPLAQRFNQGVSALAGAPFSVAADVIPGGKTALNAMGSAFSAATNAPSELTHNVLPAIASTVLPVFGASFNNAKYTTDNAAFANSPTGKTIEGVANVGVGLGNVANLALGVEGLVRGVNKATGVVPGDTLPVSTTKLLDTVKAKVDSSLHPAQTPIPPSGIASIENTAKAKVVSDAKNTASVSNEIAQVENNYVKGRKANYYSNDAGSASRTRIAQSGVLADSVNNDGLIATKQPGGAVDQYRSKTVAPAEGVVRDALVKEGSSVHVDTVESKLNQTVMDSHLEGADLQSALDGVKKEVAGLRIKADANGNIPLSTLQDAKINTTNNINYQTPPEVAAARKAVARGYKTLIEDNSSLNIQEINAELAKYYEDINRLEFLDGRKVKGGKLGKYTAQIAGNIVGGTAGAVVGGLPGAAIGTVIGGETASALKGKVMGNTFNKVRDGVIPESPILKGAIDYTKSPRLALPEGKGVRSTIPSGKTVNLPSKSASTVDAQERALSNTQDQYTTIPQKNPSNIPTTLPQYKAKVNMPKPTPDTIKLTPADKIINDKTSALYDANPQKYLDAYKNLETTNGGKVSNSDLARPLFNDAGYNGTNAMAVQTASKKIAVRSFEENLKNNPEPYGIINVGGSGVGKSSGLQAVDPTTVKNAAAIWDGNSDNFPSLKERILKIVGAGKVAKVPYTFAPIEGAFDRMISRMKNNKSEQGRLVVISEMVNNHAGSLDAMRKVLADPELARLIESGKIQPILLDNSGSSLSQIKQLANLDGISYNKPELIAKLSAKAKNLYDTKQITKDQYEAIIQ